MKKTFLIFAIFCCVKATNAQGIINYVSFELNNSWRKELKPEVLDSAVSIGYRYLGDSLYSFKVNALIRVNYVPRPVSVDHMQIDYFAEEIKMKRLITGKEGEMWKSSIFVALDDETQHIAFHRIGVHNGVVLELMLFFENAGNDDLVKVLTLDEKKVEGNMTGLIVGENLGKEMISIFRDACSTLKIFEEGEDSYSFVLIDPPSNATIYRKSKDN